MFCACNVLLLALSSDVFSIISAARNYPTIGALGRTPKAKPGPGVPALSPDKRLNWEQTSECGLTSGTTTTVHHDVDTFSKLIVGEGFDVTVFTGHRLGVEVVWGSGLQEFVNMHVADDALVLNMKEGIPVRCHDGGNRAKVRITSPLRPTGIKAAASRVHITPGTTPGSKAMHNLTLETEDAEIDVRGVEADFINITGTGGPWGGSVALRDSSAQRMAIHARDGLAVLGDRSTIIDLSIMLEGKSKKTVVYVAVTGVATGHVVGNSLLNFCCCHYPRVADVVSDNGAATFRDFPDVCPSLEHPGHRVSVR